jgi:DNA polymerase-3 subunit gamma/tau
MVMSAGADQSVLTATPRQRPRLKAVVDRWPLDSVLAALQILPDARARLRGSPHGRTIIEVALVKVALLENLAEISDLVGRLMALEGGLPPSDHAPAAVKKKIAPPEPGPSAPPPSDRETAPTRRELATTEPERVPAPPPAPLAPLVLSQVVEIWPRVVQKVGLGLGKGLSLVVPTAISEPDVLVIGVPPRYNWVVDDCGSPQSQAKIEQALEGLLGRPVTLRFDRATESTSSEDAPAVAASSRRDEAADDPMVRKVIELFEARPVHLEAEEDLTRSSNA